jgi:GH24 family phage-related lysozyme (muramidase)
MASKVFADWWRAKYGRALQMGDTITRADADKILAALLNNEYGAAVTRKIGTTVQNQWDGATSMSFNCGIGSLAWRWAVALARGSIKKSADLLRVTAVTANGRQLAGLVRRRRAEARMIETGDYGTSVVANLTPPSVSTGSDDVKWYQTQLAALGYRVTIDGNAKTSDAAVRKFQAANDLLVDGKVGPATRATLIRAVDAKRQNRTTGTAGASGAVTGGGVEVTVPDPATADVAISALYWGLGAAAVVFVMFLIFRYRGAFTGRRVPT